MRCLLCDFQNDNDGKISFKVVDKKNHYFLAHHKQVGGANNHLPINVSKRSIITYYSINFSLYKNFYDFCDAQKAMNDFALAFEKDFSPKNKVKNQASMELINYQPTDIIELES